MTIINDLKKSSEDGVAAINLPEKGHFYFIFGQTTKCITVFENHRKSLIQHCERSELLLHFEWTKIGAYLMIPI